MLAIWLKVSPMRLRERGVIDPGDLGGGGPAVDRLLEHLHVVVGAVVEDEELDRQAGAGGRGHLDGRHQEAAVAGDADDRPVGPDPLGADGRRDRPAHALVVRPA